MKKYELIRERFTACSGDRHPQTTMEELTLQDPAAYVQDLFHLEKHLRIDQRQAGASLVFDVYTGSIQCTANQVITNSRKVFHTTSSDQHDRVLLQVVSFSRNVGIHLFPVG